MKKLILPILVSGVMAFGFVSCSEDCDDSGAQASIDAACGVNGVDGSDQAACEACYDAVYDAAKCGGASSEEADVVASLATLLCD